MNNQNQGFVYFGPQVPANVKAVLMPTAQPDSGEMKNFTAQVADLTSPHVSLVNAGNAGATYWLNGNG